MKPYKPILLTAVSISVLLLAARIIITGELTYLFLLWNLFLAYVPYFISSVLIKKETGKTNIFFTIIFLFLWLVFLPNAPYLITDMFHLRSTAESPLWFDLIMILFFGMAGMIFWLTSVFQIYEKYFRQFGKTVRSVYFSLIIILSSFGVYIGRYLRWNTWDLFLNGPALFRDVATRLLHPRGNSGLYGMTIVFSLFLGFIYYLYRNYHLPENE